MIPIEQAHVQVASRTHPGMSGKNNEDRYLAAAFQWEDAQHSPAQVQSVLAVVADGIGGHRAGEVAAEIAVQTIVRVLSAHVLNTQTPGAATQPAPAQTLRAANTQPTPAQTLHAAIVQASQAIFTQAESNPEHRGMGATCACAWVIGDRLYTANVGDSRIYLLRGDSIQQASIDHTWIQEALETGALTPEQARGHPNAHVIRRYLGSRSPVTPDLRLRLQAGESAAQSEANQGLRLAAGDGVVLCSDGLTDLVEDDEILAALRKHPLEKALDELTALANERGGHDNITIVAIQMPEATRQGLAARPGLASRPAPTVPLAARPQAGRLQAGNPQAGRTPAEHPQPARRWYQSCLWLAVALLAGSLALAGYAWYSSMGERQPTPTAPPTRTAVTAPPGLFLTATPYRPPLTPTRTPPGTPEAVTPGAATATPETAAPPPTRPAVTSTLWPTNTRPAP